MVPDMTKVSQIKVVDKVNRCMGMNISSTVSQMVQEGRIGVSPAKRGPIGHFPKMMRLAMCAAFATCIKLEQANVRKQSTLNDLAI